MAPPKGTENQDAAQKALDTEKMYRELAEQEDPHKLIELRQEAEKKQAEARHARGRAETAAEKSAARAELIPPGLPQPVPAAPQQAPAAAPAPTPPPAQPAPTPTPTTTPAPAPAPAAPAAPTATPTPTPTPAPAAAPAAAPSAAPQAAPAAPQAAPAAAPSETPPATPPASPSSPSDTPPASPDASAATSGSTPPAAPAEGQGWGAKFGDFFNKLWAGLSKLIEGITDKLSNWFSGKKTEQTPAATTSPPSTPTPAPAPGVSPPSPTAPSARPAEGSTTSNRELTLREAERLGIEPAFALAIMTVESGKKGLNEDGTPVIRFESHIFNRYSKTRHGQWGESIRVGRKVDGVSCEGGQAAEHACLKKAIEINRDAAYKAISMGQGQIMGFNAEIAGYASAEDMFRDFSASGGGETAQIKAMFKVIEKTPAILRAARNKDYAAFTSNYNGAKPGNPHHARYVAALERAYRNNGGGGSAPRSKKPDEAVA